MEPITLSTQNRVVWIPCVNASILFVSVYNSFFVKDKKMNLMRILLIVLSSFAPFLILRTILLLLFSTSVSFADYTLSYFAIVIMGKRLIKYQKTVGLV